MANSIDPDEMARYEPSHLDICCLQISVKALLEMNELHVTKLFLFKQSQASPVCVVCDLEYKCDRTHRHSDKENGTKLGNFAPFIITFNL